MNSHDSDMKPGSNSSPASAARESTKESLEAKISPKFAELTADLGEVLEKASDPKITAALMFKLAEERERTNRILEDISKKYDELMFEMKTKNMRGQLSPLQDSRQEFDLMPDQDKAILSLVGKQGQATAIEVKSVLNYRGLNGASQRLNKLCKEGFLEKARSGKRVLYLAKM